MRLLEWCALVVCWVVVEPGCGICVDGWARKVCGAVLCARLTFLGGMFLPGHKLAKWPYF